MANRLGIGVTTGETPSSAGSSTSTGTAFILGLTDSGPFTPQLVKSPAAYQAIFGERTATGQSSFDAVETFFTLEGAQCYFQRVGKESSAAAGTKELATATHAKTLVATAKYKGTFGNKYQLEVTAGEELLVLNEASEVLERFPAKKASEVLAATSAYVAFSEGSEYSTGKTEALKAIAAAKLTGGTNPSTTVTEALAKEALELLPKTLGPGQVLIVAPSLSGEVLEEKVHVLMGEHAQKNNRIALCDIADAATTATLISNKKTYAAGIAGYMAFFSSSCIIPGVTLGTTRKVPASAVAAGLCAQVAKTTNDNQAPAGITWPLSPFVTGFTNTFGKTEMETLAENGINPFAERTGGKIPCLYDFVSALPRTTDRIFCQLTASRERMHLVWASEEVAEPFLFKQIDGRKQLLSAFQGALQGMLKGQWELGALYGLSAPEAYLVNIAEPVNTLTTISEGQVNAELRVRFSPFAEAINILVINSPITEAV